MNKSSLTSSNILITGGAGFLGSSLAEELLEHDPAKILIVDNLIRGSEDNLSRIINNPRVEFYKDDIRNQKLMESLVKRSDYIFHTAALRIHACAEDPISAFEVMNQATFDLVESARRNSIKKFIYSSSASVYGLASNFPTKETESSFSNVTLYGACKLWGEQLLSSYHHTYNFPFIALRYFNVYGPKMDTHGKYTEVMIKWLDCIRKNQQPVIFGNGEDTMDFIFSEDVVQANILAATSDKNSGIYNVGSGKETSLNDLLQALIEINNSDLIPAHKEANTVNPVSRRLADVGTIRKDLGFIPTVDLQEGLKKLSSWYFEKYAERL